MTQPQVFIGDPDAPSTLPSFLSRSREMMQPAEFRALLRQSLLADPSLTLRQVALALGVTRQRVNQWVGRLDRPSCTDPRYPRPTVKKDQARAHLAELTLLVRAGESASQAARELGISIEAAAKLGFRAKSVKPLHGQEARWEAGCQCWRCRRAAGVARRRGPRTGERERMKIQDLLAWVDPDDDSQLSQKKIGRLVGVSQGSVSWVARTVQD